jgi:hypothetical protein
MKRNDLKDVSKGFIDQAKGLPVGPRCRRAAEGENFAIRA